MSEEIQNRYGYDVCGMNVLLTSERFSEFWLESGEKQLGLGPSLIAWHQNTFIYDTNYTFVHKQKKTNKNEQNFLAYRSGLFMYLRDNQNQWSDYGLWIDIYVWPGQ